MKSEFFRVFSRVFFTKTRVFLPIFLINLKKSSESCKLVSQEQDNFQVSAAFPLKILSKNDYFQKIVGNTKDFFFFIVFDAENDQIFDEAKEIAGFLQETIEKSLKEEKISIYFMQKSVYQDVKRTINRVKNQEIFEKDAKFANSLEIYFKTPYSTTQAFVKYKKSRFFQEKSRKKLVKFLRKLIHPVEIIENNADFIDKLRAQALTKTTTSLILKVIPEGFSSEKAYKKFRKLAFNFFERKLVPLQTTFLIINQSNLVKYHGFLNNEVYIFRNDFFSQNFQEKLEVFAENRDKNSIIITDSQKNQFLLESYSSFLQEFKETEKTHLQELKDEKKRDFQCFSSFLSPKIFVLSDLKSKNLGNYFKKLNFNKKKPTLSLLLSRDEHENPHRIKTLLQLYQLFHQNFSFLLITSQEIEDFFPHANRNYPRFCVFNFLKSDKTSNLYKNYAKKLIFPYEKHFLRDDENYFEDFAKIQDKIKEIALRKAEPTYIANVDEEIEDVNACVFESFLEKSKDFVLELYDDSVFSEFSKGVFNDLSRKYQDFGFLRMHSLNQSEKLVNIAAFPAYIIWDAEKQRFFVYQPDFKEIGFRKDVFEEKLRGFLLSKSRN